jgi:hypothetical protein
MLKLLHAPQWYSVDDNFHSYFFELLLRLQSLYLSTSYTLSTSYALNTVLFLC